MVGNDERPIKVRVKLQLTAFDGTVLHQDLRDTWLSGISEVSGVAGDGEREQAVTEEEDMIALPKGKRGLRYGLCLCWYDTNYQSKSRFRRSGLEGKR